MIELNNQVVNLLLSIVDNYYQRLIKVLRNQYFLSIMDINA